MSKPQQFTFEMHSDLDLVASEVPTQRVVELVVVPPSAGPAAARPALNLALVIDRSGSMSGDKLANVRRAAEHVLDLLQEQDQVAIVAYDDTINLLAPSQPVTAQVRASLKSHLQELTPGNMTNLCGGWLSGCEEVARVASPAGGQQLNRVLLLTDGLANVGITGLEEIGLHASQLLNKGIATSTFGVGLDFNEHLLEHMANQGGGRFYFIADPTTIPSIFVQEFRELAAVTAQAVEVTLEIPAQVDAKVLGSWRSEQNGQSLRLWLGDIPSGQPREVYVRLLIPPLGAAPQGGQAELWVRGQCRARGEQGEAAGGFGAGYFQVRPAPAGSGCAGTPGGNAALQPGRDGRRGHRSAQAGARRQAPGSQPVDRAKPGGGRPVSAAGRTGPVRAVVRAYFKARVGRKGAQDQPPGGLRQKTPAGIIRRAASWIPGDGNSQPGL